MTAQAYPTIEITGTGEVFVNSILVGTITRHGRFHRKQAGLPEPLRKYAAALERKGPHHRFHGHGEVRFVILAAD